MTRITRRAFAAAPLAFAASGCTTVGVVNALVPNDRGSRRVVVGAAYGDHPRQRLDLYAPRDGAGPRPSVMFIYGGSWNSGRRADYAFVGHALASQGFVVAIADYRLVPEVRYPVFLDDGAAAAAWLRDNIAAHGGDPAGLALVGHSAGAYNAAMLALDPTLLTAAGLPPDFVTACVGLSGPYDFLPLDADATREAFAGVADLPSTQPIAHARPDAPPFFLATGADDTLVYPRNTRALAAALRDQGAAVTEKTYPGLGHPGTLLALSRPLRGKAEVLSDVAGFLRAETVDRPTARG